MKHAVATALMLAAMGSVQAQTTVPSEAQPGPSAAPAEDETVALPTVVVTAEKSGRSIMDTATSIDVVDEADLRRRAGLATVEDLLASSANVTLTGTGNTAPVIRGISGAGAAEGSDAFFAGSRPRLNMQVDGRPLSFNEIVYGDSGIWDLRQVEILRGAQSTLQGRNAIAGTVAIRTNDPSYETEAALRLAGGNYDQRRASGLVGGALVDDSLAYRLSADWYARSSFVENFTAFEGTDDPGQFEALNLRGKLLFEPQALEDLRMLLTVNQQDYEGPQTEQVTEPHDAHRTDYPRMPVFKPQSRSLILDTQYDLDPAWRFESLVSGTDLEVQRIAPVGEGIVRLDAREYVVEPRLRFAGEGRRSGVVGVYLFQGKQDEYIDYPSPQYFDDEIRTAAVFGETTWPLSGSVDLIAGARYEQETHERFGGDGSVAYIELDETYEAFLPKFGIAWHLRPDLTVGAVAVRGYNAGGGGITIEQDPDDPTDPLIENYQYDPEYVWTYELYGRQLLLDGRLRLTANLFYAQYRDYQLLFDLTPENPTDFSSLTRNADEATTYGAEAGAAWLLRPGLEVYGSLGLLQTDIDRYPDSGFEGNELPLSPALTGNAGISWDRGQGWDGSFALRYSDAYYSNINNQPGTETDPYWLANAQLGYRFSARLRLYGSVENLFDSDKPLALHPGGEGAPTIAELPTPRSWWAGFELSW